MNEALRHLGNVLCMLAELDAGDRCRAFNEALEYYNNQCPDEKIEPEIGVTFLINVLTDFDKFEVTKSGVKRL